MHTPSRRERNAAFFILSVLVILPAFISFLISRYSVEKNSLCFVGPTSDNNENVGLDILGFYQLRKHGKKELYAHIDQQHLLPYLRFGWPSLLTLGSLVSPISFRGNEENGAMASIALSKDKDHYCLEVSDGVGPNSKKTKICSSVIERDVEQADGTKYTMVPPNGIWADEANQYHIEVQCHAPVAVLPKGKRPKKKKTLQQIVNRPATTVLLLLNTYLAYYYWNYRVSPSSVSLVYNKMIPAGTHEFWRAFSGSLAHFEPLHIGFNMMSLYNLGGLEELHGSLPYFLSSFAMVILTVTFMMSVMHYQVIIQGNHSVADKQTVGYSGVLFVWMVMVTLENGNSCPIPFLENLCFDTWGLGPLRFNVAPLAQLVFIQVLMPRASFVGHLGGIVCGYLMYWGMIPRLLLDVSFLIPAAVLCYLWRIKKLLPLSMSLDDYDEERVEMIIGADAVQSTECKALCRLQSSITGIAASSLFLLDYSLALSQMLIATLFFFGAQARKISPTSGKGVIDALLRGFFVSAVLVIITDAACLGQWFVYRKYIGTIWKALPNFLIATVFMSIRIIVNTMALCVAAKLTSSNEYGFVKAIYGRIISNAKYVGDWLLDPPPEAFSAFQGTGNQLNHAAVGTIREL